MYETIFRARDDTEAGLVIGLLRNAGLHPMDLETASHFSFAGAEISYRVQIPHEEVQQARELLVQAGYATR